MAELVRVGPTHAEIIEELQASASASRGVERLSAPVAPSLLAGLDAGTSRTGAGTAAPASSENGSSLAGRVGEHTATPHAPRRGRPEELGSPSSGNSEGAQRHLIGGDPAAVKPVQAIARRSYRGTPVPGAGMEQERLAGLITRKSPGASPGPASSRLRRSAECRVPSAAVPEPPRRKTGGARRRLFAKAIAPTPWSVDRSAGVWFVVGSDGRAIASVIPRGEKTKATADLMSAGPVMLAAIELVADGLDGLVREMPGDHRLREAVAALRAVQDIAYGVGDPLA